MIPYREWTDESLRQMERHYLSCWLQELCGTRERLIEQEGFPYNNAPLYRPETGHARRVRIRRIGDLDENVQKIVTLPTKATERFAYYANSFQEHLFYIYASVAYNKRIPFIQDPKMAAVYYELEMSDLSRPDFNTDQSMTAYDWFLCATNRKVVVSLVFQVRGTKAVHERLVLNFTYYHNYWYLLGRNTWLWVYRHRDMYVLLTSVLDMLSTGLSDDCRCVVQGDKLPFRRPCIISDGSQSQDTDIVLRKLRDAYFEDHDVVQFNNVVKVKHDANELRLTTELHELYDDEARAKNVHILYISSAYPINAVVYGVRTWPFAKESFRAFVYARLHGLFHDYRYPSDRLHSFEETTFANAPGAHVVYWGRLTHQLVDRLESRELNLDDDEYVVCSSTMGLVVTNNSRSIFIANHFNKNLWSVYYKGVIYASHVNPLMLLLWLYEENIIKSLRKPDSQTKQLDSLFNLSARTLTFMDLHYIVAFLPAVELEQQHGVVTSTGAAACVDYAMSKGLVPVSKTVYVTRAYDTSNRFECVHANKYRKFWDPCHRLVGLLNTFSVDTTWPPIAHYPPNTYHTIFIITETGSKFAFGRHI